MKKIKTGIFIDELYPMYGIEEDLSIFHDYDVGLTKEEIARVKACNIEFYAVQEMLASKKKVINEE